jgi:xanthine dehydrogenase accessory factor
MNDVFYKEIYDLINAGQSVAVCTIIRSSGSTPRHVGSHMLVYPDGRILGSVGGGEIENRVIDVAKQSLLDGQPITMTYKFVDPTKGDVGVCGGEAEVFVEPIIPEPTILVIGTGHVGKAVVKLAHFLHFIVIASDDRPGFCSKEELPEADQLFECSMNELPKKIKFTPSLYIILTTRGSEVDIEGLPALLPEPFSYLGIIGSQRRWSVTKKELSKKGITKKQLARVNSPIGLELNAETPEEIAVSILAEIIMRRHHGNGKSMQSQ